MHYSNNHNEIHIVLTTEVDKTNAQRIANLLLIDKLVPCISFQNIESYFWWEGEINQSKEVQLIIKCKEINLSKVLNKIAESHSYEVPEIIYFPVSACKDYHHWISSF
tara:strand:+ start:108 stop:431 length:324 start_codon:yes stop_codon:yes gene_type:complete